MTVRRHSALFDGASRVALVAMSGVSRRRLVMPMTPFSGVARSREAHAGEEHAAGAVGGSAASRATRSSSLERASWAVRVSTRSSRSRLAAWRWGTAGCEESARETVGPTRWRRARRHQEDTRVPTADGRRGPPQGVGGERQRSESEHSGGQTGVECAEGIDFGRMAR